MTIALIASGSVGAVFPGALAFQASVLLELQGELSATLALLVDLNLELPSLKLELDAAVNLTAQLEASLTIDPRLTIAASLAYAADAQLALAAGLSGPSLSVNLSAQLGAQLKVVADITSKLSVKAAAIAAVTLRIGKLKAAIALALEFGKVLATAGARLYLYTGPLSDFSAEAGAYFSAQADVSVVAPVFVPILIAEGSVTFGAMSKILATG